MLSGCNAICIDTRCQFGSRPVRYVRLDTEFRSRPTVWSSRGINWAGFHRSVCLQSPPSQQSNKRILPLRLKSKYNHNVWSKNILPLPEPRQRNRPTWNYTKNASRVSGSRMRSPPSAGLCWFPFGTGRNARVGKDVLFHLAERRRPVYKRVCINDDWINQWRKRSLP